MIVAGIDAGSRMAKVVIMSDNELISQDIDSIALSSVEQSMKCMERALQKVGLGLKDLNHVVSTGYGREEIPISNKHVSDISAHARGAVWLFPTARTVLDIGGQDTKAINVDEKGRVTRFIMNEKCAGGTGRFLEIMADMLGVPFEKMGEYSLQSQKKLYLTSTCVIFAKSEALGMLLEGAERADLLAAVHRAAATQFNKLLGKISLAEDLVLTGGGSRNTGVVKGVEEVTGLKPLVPPDPFMVGAIGAAAIARSRCLAGAS